MLSFAWELTTWFNVLALLWLQERLNEHLAKSVIWVLINLGVILLLRVQLLWLLGKFVDRDLPDNQREIFGLGIDFVRLDLRGSDMSLVREFELSFHVVVVLGVLFDALFLILITFFSTFFWRFDFLKKVVISSKKAFEYQFCKFHSKECLEFHAQNHHGHKHCC